MKRLTMIVSLFGVVVLPTLALANNGSWMFESLESRIQEGIDAYNDRNMELGNQAEYYASHPIAKVAAPAPKRTVSEKRFIPQVVRSLRHEIVLDAMKGGFYKTLARPSLRTTFSTRDGWKGGAKATIYAQTANGRVAVRTATFRVERDDLVGDFAWRKNAWRKAR